MFETMLKHFYYYNPYIAMNDKEIRNKNDYAV